MCSWLKNVLTSQHLRVYVCLHVFARDFIWKMILKVVFVWNIPEWGGAGRLLLVLGNAGRAAEGQLPKKKVKGQVPWELASYKYCRSTLLTGYCTVFCSFPYHPTFLLSRNYLSTYCYLVPYLPFLLHFNSDKVYLATTPYPALAKIVFVNIQKWLNSSKSWQKFPQMLTFP